MSLNISSTNTITIFVFEEKIATFCVQTCLVIGILKEFIAVPVKLDVNFKC